MTAKKTPQVPGAPVVEAPQDPVVANETPQDVTPEAPAAKVTAKPAAKVDTTKPHLTPDGWVIPEPKVN